MPNHAYFFPFCPERGVPFLLQQNTRAVPVPQALLPTGQDLSRAYTREGGQITVFPHQEDSPFPARDTANMWQRMRARYPDMEAVWNIIQHRNEAQAVRFFRFVLHLADAIP